MEHLISVILSEKERFTHPLRPSPIAAGLLRVHAEDKPVRERFIVGEPVHKDDPTLSVAEARIQWYGELSRLGTSLAAVDGHDVCSVLPCPLLSTPPAVAAFMTVGTKSFSSPRFSGSSLRMFGQASPIWLTGGFQTQLATLAWFSPQAKAVYRGVAAVACYSFLEPQVRAECQVDSSAGRDALKRTWLPPPPPSHRRGAPLPTPDPPPPKPPLSLQLLFLLFLLLSS